jgi:hypothetical protein
MAEKQVIEMEVKSNIGDVSKDAAGLAGEFKVMGVSLNSLKAGFKSVATTAKASFATVKAGIMSTGIGALLIAVTALISYFTNTKKGSEALKRTMAGLGAVIDRLTDLFSNIGETMVDAFNNPKKAIEDLWEGIKKNLMNRLTGIIDGFKAVGKVIHGVFTMNWDEVAEGAKEYGQAVIQISTGYDTEQQQEFLNNIMEINEGLGKAYKAQVALTAATQKLKDEERDFSKVRAQTRQDIQKARLDALDETKTAEERLAALQKANDLELKTTRKAMQMQKERIRVKRAENEINKSLEEDLEELARLEVGLIDLQTQSFQTQKRLATEMETLTNELAANEKAKKAEAQKIIDEKKAADEKAKDDEKKKLIKDAEEVADAKIKEANRVAKEEEQITKSVETFKKATISAGFGAAAAIAGENTALSKGVAAAQVVYNTQQGIMAAMGATSVADKLLPYPLRLANAIATGVMGAAALSKIMSTDPSGGGAGGGGGGAGGVASSGSPAPQMMSGAFDISGGVEPEATRAYVVTDEMTSSQNQLANIRRRATI